MSDSERADQTGTGGTAVPEPVRRRVVQWTLEVLDQLPAAELPPRVRPVVRFAVQQRAKFAAPVLLEAIEQDGEFRERVARLVSAAHPEAFVELHPVALAAAQVLRGGGMDPRWGRLLGPESKVERAEVTGEENPASEPVEPAPWQSKLHDVQQENRLLRDRLGATRRDLQQARERIAALASPDQTDAAPNDAPPNDAPSNDAPSNDAGPADLARGAPTSPAAPAGPDLLAVLDERERTLVELRAQVADLQRRLQATRRRDRAEADARLTVLLDALGETAIGLRRELGLAAQPATPAELLVETWPELPDVAVALTSSGDSSKRLRQLLSRPRSHLLVDGYNVAKARWPKATLEEQRRLLVNAMAALAAQAWEITVVFDATAVSAKERALVRSARGVRVTFSAPGELADDLITDFVRNEPPGRTMVVVTSDRELGRRCTALGAHVVPTAGLLGLIG